MTLSPFDTMYVIPKPEPPPSGRSIFAGFLLIALAFGGMLAVEHPQLAGAAFLVGAVGYTIVRLARERAP